MVKSLEDRIAEAIREDVEIAAHDPSWVAMFMAERKFLRSALPQTLIGRIEHFGSTAVAGLAAKPVIDMLVEVKSLEQTRIQIVPLLESKGYDYYWRTDSDPPYAWFIKRNTQGIRTHHIHMVEADSPMWERLLFRDYLRIFSDEARRYEDLKRALAAEFPNDRIAYTEGKTEYVESVTHRAREYFNSANNRSRG